MSAREPGNHLSQLQAWKVGSWREPCLFFPLVPILFRLLLVMFSACAGSGFVLLMSVSPLPLGLWLHEPRAPEGRKGRPGRKDQRTGPGRVEGG